MRTNFKRVALAFLAFIMILCTIPVCIAADAEIKINSKLKATVKFTAKYFDGVDIKFAPKSDAVMWFDDVELYPLVEHYDYPSQPVVAESKDYNIGVNICNLCSDFLNQPFMIRWKFFIPWK